MRLLEPLTPDPRAPLARTHPLAKIAAALVLMFTLFLTIDLITPTLVLAPESSSTAALAEVVVIDDRTVTSGPQTDTTPSTTSRSDDRATSPCRALASARSGSA